MKRSLFYFVMSLILLCTPFYAAPEDESVEVTPRSWKDFRCDNPQDSKWSSVQPTVHVSEGWSKSSAWCEIKRGEVAVTVRVNWVENQREFSFECREPDKELKVEDVYNGPTHKGYLYTSKKGRNAYVYVEWTHPEFSPGYDEFTKIAEYYLSKVEPHSFLCPK